MSAKPVRRGRPLRFLALVSVGWVGMRVAILWSQTGSLPDAIRALAAPVVASLPPREAAPAGPLPMQRAVRTAARPAMAPARPPAARPRGDPVRVRMALLNLLQFGEAEYTDSPAALAPALFPSPQQPAGPVAGRWAASAWVSLRPGSAVGVAPGGQLGGSQAGLRLVYTLDRKRRIALFGRLVTPLSGPGREATLGVEWQPTRAPVRLVAEQRFALDNGKGGQGLGMVAGLDRDVAGFRLESYGQAGAIRRARVEPYADGAARATRRIGHSRFALGVGVWGAAQRDAARFDMGPSATLALPLAGRDLRFAIDWRQRVAGAARPGSGVALTLGSDF
ncbi:MAG: hypothetical protein V4574_02250 [Pseudomonadota bacterium]